MNRPAIIVVPCYNEASRLRLEAFREFTRSRDDVQFLFVNDGSRDGTKAMLEGFCAEAPDRFSLLDLRVNSGKAEAVRQGVLAALGREPAVVGYWDADLATPLAAIPDLLGVLAGAPGVEIVLGARVKLMGRAIHRRAARHYAGRVFATIASLVLGIPVYDTQCGAKMFRVHPGTGALFAAPFLSRWIFDVELLARRLAGLAPAQRQAAESSIYEFPLHAWEDVAGSKLKPRDFFVAIIELAKIARRYRLHGRAALAPGPQAA